MDSKDDRIYIGSVELTTFTSVMGEEPDTCILNIRRELQTLVMKDQLFDLFLLYQLESDSDNERQRAAQSQSAAPCLSKTMLITHPARKCVFEFLRVIMTDSLMSPSTASKGQGVIDAILEVRNKIGISTKLPYVFTRKTRLTCLNGEEGLQV